MVANTDSGSSSRLLIHAFRWRGVPISIALSGGAWWALIAWIDRGVAGAGNLYVAWVVVGLVVSCLAVAAMASGPKVLTRGAPVWLRRVFHLSALGQLGVLCWVGFWWVFAAGLISFVLDLFVRVKADELIAAQGVAHV